MPQALPAFLATAAAQLGASYAVALAVSTVAIGALKLAAFNLISKALSRKPGSNAVPINVTVRSTIAPRRLIFGTVRAGGAICFVRCSGDKNKYLWYVVAYAGHQCSAQGDAWLDKLYIPSADINAGTGAVSTAALDGKLKIWSHLGTGAQTVDTNLDSEFTLWTSNHRLRGTCYDVFRMERSDKAWPTGAPQMCNRIISGALVYDPRLDTTNGGSGSHRRDDPQTWAFSRNWALIVRHYLSGGSVVNDQATRLIRYGVKESDDRIDDAYTIAAANICDQSLSGANAPPSGAQVRYTCDLEASCDQPRRDILEDIRVCGGPGEIVYLHGKWRIYAAAYDAPSHTLTQDALIGDMEIDDTTGEQDRFNAISALYVDAAKEFTEQTTPVRTNAAYITQDAGEEKQRDVVLRGVTDQYRAQRITELMLRKSRQMRIVHLPFNRSGLAIAPNETFTFDHARYGWSGRLFRCLERKPTFADDGGMGCLITAQAEVSTIYTDLATADYTTGTSVVNSVQSEEPDEPTNLTALALPRAIQFAWELGSFWERNGSVELWESDTDSFGSAVKLGTFRGVGATITKDDTTRRYYWIRILTIAGQLSDTEPATNGLPATALPSIQMIPDPEFAVGAAEYWYLTGQATLSETGGNIGGYVELDGDNVQGSAAAAYSISSHPQTAVRGEVFSVSCRIRRKPASATPEGFLWAIVHRMDAPTKAAASTVGGTYGGIIVANSAIPTDWTEYTGRCFIAGDFDDAEVPYVCGLVSYEVYGLAGKIDGEIQVDNLNISRGSAAPPFIYTFTSSTTLQNFDPGGFGVAYGPGPLGCSLLRYDSASPGTLTLPTFYNPQDVGLEIHFEQVGAGALTIGAGTSGLRSPSGSTSDRQVIGRYSRVTVTADADGTWHSNGPFV